MYIGSEAVDSNRNDVNEVHPVESPSVAGVHLPDDAMVLIVDDNFTNTRILSELLKGHGIQSVIAETGKDALRLAQENPPDLILLDIMMPEMDGFEVCKRLKSNPIMGIIPIIFMTALSNPEHLVEGFRHGAVDYIRKPFRKEEVLARISTHILLQRQQKRLSQINATKDRLFSIIAHDLKGPFSTLLGFSDLLLKNFSDYSDEKKIQFVRKIYQTSENTFRLLDNLLNWSKLQANALHCKPEPVMLYQAVEDNIAFIENCANTKNILITQKIDPETRVLVDPNMLSVILLNLLSNAVKFTQPNGSIHISNEILSGTCTLTVSDSGKGIEPGNMEKLFDPNVYYTTMGTAMEKGSGLGLALCKEFAEKNNGKIFVESTPGKGSRFSILLPVDL